MILIDPKGNKKEMDDAKAEKFLNIPSKRRQGWKKAAEKVNPNSLNNLKKPKPVAKKKVVKKKVVKKNDKK